MTDQIVGRDPLEKTLVETMVAAHPDDSDAQIVERFLDAQHRLGVEQPQTWITAETVATWRPEVTG